MRIYILDTSDGLITVSELSDEFLKEFKKKQGDDILIDGVETDIHHIIVVSEDLIVERFGNDNDWHEVEHRRDDL